ncbi:hypothetical protein CF326_g7415 [Tilletia indica]|nr:hypothetical protein CF326_g7415 [Tilletia indica]
MTSGQASGRTAKWPTCLEICVDLILGSSTSNENSHEVEALLYDNCENAHDALLFLWSRVPPEAGLYITMKLAIACNPLRLHASEPEYMRPVPDDMDGTIGGNAALPTGCPLLKGMGLLSFVAADKKSGVIVGFVNLGKTHGWARYEVHVSFEDNPRWALWNLPVARMLVSFDAVLSGVNEDGSLVGLLRRIFSIQPASAPLLQALNVGSTPSSDRLSKLKEIRAQKMRQNDNSDSAKGTLTTPVKIEPIETVNQEVPPKAARNVEAKCPPSPSPAPGIRKRGRAE